MYRNISDSWSKESLEFKSRNADNRFNFYKFRIAASDRATNMWSISKMSEDLVNLVNQELGPKKMREAEMTMIHNYLESELDRDFIREIILEYFSQYGEEELNEIFSKWDQEQKAN